MSDYVTPIELEAKNKIKEYFEMGGLKINDEQAEQFYSYYLLLTSWNEKFNLTAITEFEEVVIKHFFDSVVCYKLLEDNSKIIDIGCGAGFPSIPLKIMNPSLSLVLVDSVNKKINFINEVVKTLNLTNVTPLHARAEDLAAKEMFREKFDYCVSRAVASLNTLSEYCLPFVKLNGIMFAYKSTNAEEEIKESKNAIKLLGGSINSVKDFSVADYCRKVIEIKKVSATPKKFPRSGNKPRLNPLK